MISIHRCIGRVKEVLLQSGCLNKSALSNVAYEQRHVAAEESGAQRCFDLQRTWKTSWDSHQMTHLFYFMIFMFFFSFDTLKMYYSISYPILNYSDSFWRFLPHIEPLHILTARDSINMAVDQGYYRGEEKMKSRFLRGDGGWWAHPFSFFLFLGLNHFLYFHSLSRYWTGFCENFQILEEL